MLKVTWESINRIAPVMNNLANNGKVDKTISYRAGRIMAALKSNQSKIQAERLKIWEKYCDRDEKLNPIKDENGNFQFEKNFQPCYDEVEQLFRDNHVEVKVYKLPFEALKDHLTGNEMVTIEEIVEGVPEII